MVYVMGMQPEGLRARRRSSVDELFDAGAWRIRNIWDGVKLEITPAEENPVVLNSFTHLDPDLPVLEVRTLFHNLVPGGFEWTWWQYTTEIILCFVFEPYNKGSNSCWQVVECYLVTFPNCVLTACLYCVCVSYCGLHYVGYTLQLKTWVLFKVWWHGCLINRIKSSWPHGDTAGD